MYLNVPKLRFRSACSMGSGWHGGPVHLGRGGPGRQICQSQLRRCWTLHGAWLSFIRSRQLGCRQDGIELDLSLITVPGLDCKPAQDSPKSCTCTPKVPNLSGNHPECQIHIQLHEGCIHFRDNNLRHALPGLQ